MDGGGGVDGNDGVDDVDSADGVDQNKQRPDRSCSHHGKIRQLPDLNQAAA